MKSIQEEYIDTVAKQMSDDIDFQVLSNLLVESGWTRVTLSPMTHETSNEIDRWVPDNAEDHFYTRGLVWVFKSSRDAMWFKLRWLS